MLAFSEKGDNATVDMLVGDIYGQDYGRLGLKSTTIASSFGKVFKKSGEKVKFSPEDISRSLLYAVSNNIGQIACVSPFISLSICAGCYSYPAMLSYMNAEKYGLDRIYFGGCFIRGEYQVVCVNILSDICTQVMPQQLQLYHTPYVSGAKEPNEPCSCDTRDSCMYLRLLAC